MDFYGLKLFLHLSETLHFYKTSQACFISPPGLTRAIKRLEEETGVKFFERNNRSVSLTPAGVLFKKFAQDTLSRWRIFQDSLTEYQGSVLGELKIYCSVTASYEILKQVIKNYQLAYPKVQIFLQTGEAEIAVKQVLKGDVDIAIAARPDSLSERIEFKTVIKTPLVFISEKDFIFRSVKDSPFIIPAHGLSRVRLDRWFTLKKISPHLYAEVSGNEAIIAMVSLGFGIGIVPQLVLEQSSLKKEIKILPIKPDLKEYEVGYCRLSKKKHRTPVNVFWEMISDKE